MVVNLVFLVVCLGLIAHVINFSKRHELERTRFPILIAAGIVMILSIVALIKGVSINDLKYEVERYLGTFL